MAAARYDQDRLGVVFRASPRQVRFSPLDLSSWFTNLVVLFNSAIRVIS